jgi:hypothetical protein
MNHDRSGSPGDIWMFIRLTAAAKALRERLTSGSHPGLPQESVDSTVQILVWMSFWLTKRRRRSGRSAWRLSHCSLY